MFILFGEDAPAGQRKIGEPTVWTTVTNHARPRNITQPLRFTDDSAVLTASCQDLPVDRQALFQKRNSIRHQKEPRTVYCLTAFRPKL
jgi:hypothetical protein